jgi:hypothetical protein
MGLMRSSLHQQLRLSASLLSLRCWACPQRLSFLSVFAPNQPDFQMLTTVLLRSMTLPR